MSDDAPARPRAGTYRPGLDWRDVARQPGRRLFIAVPLADAPRQAVADLMAALAAMPVRLRWVRPESLHLTLRFLGPTPGDAVAGVEGAMREAASPVEPARVRLRDAGAFPPRGRPRLLWLGVAEGAPELGALAAHLEDGLAARGWPRDDRPFRPHLTLARCDGIGGADQVVAAAVARAGELEAAWTADRMVLFESITGGGPARYIPLVTVRLGEAAGGSALPSPAEVR